MVLSQILFEPSQFYFKKVSIFLSTESNLKFCLFPLEQFTPVFPVKITRGTILDF